MVKRCYVMAPPFTVSVPFCAFPCPPPPPPFPFPYPIFYCHVPFSPAPPPRRSYPFSLVFGLFPNFAFACLYSILYTADTPTELNGIPYNAHSLPALSVVGLYASNVVVGYISLPFFSDQPNPRLCGTEIRTDNQKTRPPTYTKLLYEPNPAGGMDGWWVAVDGLRGMRGERGRHRGCGHHSSMPREHYLTKTYNIIWCYIDRVYTHLAIHTYVYLKCTIY